MNTELTEIAIVLDRSGSMASMANEAIGGFNGFLDSQQKLLGDAQAHAGSLRPRIHRDV
jgi:hypothetical protein